MTAFVILAAGPGTRMGRFGQELHKSLVPLHGKAVISHQLALAPPGARVIVCTGSRAQQVQDYLDLAHPELDVTYVPVPGWNADGNGPGASLLAARQAVGGDDMAFTSCDTLWEPDEWLWSGLSGSWCAVDEIPEGTEPERWCRVTSVSGRATAILDKVPGPRGLAYTGLSMIHHRDLPDFWRGLTEGAGRIAEYGGNLQVSAGLEVLVFTGRLDAYPVTWTDTGDKDAYVKAAGYDWAKPGEVTYVLPETGRVIKFRASKDSLSRLVSRQALLCDAVPQLADVRPGMLAYEYAPGVTGYEAAEDDPDIIPRLIDWAALNLWRDVPVFGSTTGACTRFYQAKTNERIDMFRYRETPLYRTARRAIHRVPWDAITQYGCVPVTFHGDFNLGNVIVGQDGSFTAVDWREDFAGELSWGDMRYDFAKLAAGLYVNWDRARKGDFSEWPAGKGHLAKLAAWFGGTVQPEIRLIAALSLINSAPLHASPLDELLVLKGAELLGELT